MAGGPDGPEVGRVTVRVAPNTSKFGDEAKKDINKEVKDLEATIPLRGELDQEQIKREVEKIRVPQIVVPITVDRKQAREQIDKVLEKPMRLKSIVIPVRIDRAQLRKAVNDATASVDLAAVTVRADADAASARAAGREVADSAQDAVNSRPVDVDNVNVDGDAIREQVDKALDVIRDIDAKIKTDLDDSNWPEWARKGAEFFEFNVNLDWEKIPDEIKTVLEDFDRGTRKLNLEINTDDVERAEAKLAADVERITETLSEKLSEGASSVASDVGEAVATEIDRNLEVVKDVEVDLDIDASKLEKNVTDAAAKVQRTLSDNPVIMELDARERVIFLQIEKIERALEKLRSSSSEITPEIELQIAEAEARLARFNRQLSEISRKRVKVQADIEADTKKLTKTVEKTRPKVAVDPEIDTSTLIKRLRQSNSLIIRAVGELFKGVGALTTGLFQDLPEALQSGFGNAGKSLQSLSKGVNDLGKEGGNAGQLIRQGLLQAAQAAISLGALFLRLGAMGGALAVAGAGISGALSAAAVAIAALPAGLGLIATAAGVVALGMDGIKKAAETLRPTFDNLKKSASEVFERGLTPVFKQLQPLIASLEQPIDNVAQSIVNVAGDLANLLTLPGPNADRLRDVFKQTAETIDGMRPGVRDVADTLLRLIDQPAAFQAFETSFNAFGQAFKESVASVVDDGSLERAFRSLGAVATEVGQAITAAFAGLTRIFAGGAGDGLATLIDDLTNFFSRFDATRIGGAIGDVFTGLGEVFRGIDNQTIEDITLAFEDLGALFRDADFQADIRTIIGAIDEVIAAIRFLADAAADIGASIASVINAIGGENVATAAVIGVVAIGLAKITSTFVKWWSGLRKLVGGWKFTDLFKSKKLDPKDLLKDNKKFDITDIFDDKKGKNNLPKINPLDLIGRTLTWTDILPDLVGTGIGILGDAFSDLFLDPDLDIDLDGLREAIETAIRDGFKNALTETELDVQLTLSEEAVTGLVDSIAEGIRTQQEKISAAFREAFANASAAAGEGLVGIDEQINLAADGWVATINTVFADRVTPAFNEGFAGLAAGVPVAMEPVNTALGEQLTLLAETITTGFADQVRPAWEEGFIGLGEATTIGMATLATAITTAFAEQIVLAVTAGMEQARVAYETGFLGMNETTAAQFALFNTAWINGFTGLSAIVTEQMALVTEAVRVGMSQLPIVATEQLALFELAFATTATNLLANFLPFITDLVASVLLEVARLGTEATASLALFEAAFANAATNLLVNFLPFITSLVDQVCLEMERLVLCVQDAVTRIGELIGQGGGEGGGGGGLAGVFTTLLEWLRFVIDNILLLVQQMIETLALNIEAWIVLFTQGLDAMVELLRQRTLEMQEQWRQLWEQIPQIAATGMATTVATFNSGFTLMTLAAATGMAQINAAVTTGMNQMVATTQTGVNSAVAVLNSAVGQFHAAGSNMGAALAAGLRSQIGAVRAAAAELAAAASAGVSAAARIASPSKVFIALGQMLALGLAVGMERNEDQVARAARGLVEEAERYTKLVAQAMEGIGSEVDFTPNIPNWDRQMQAGVIDSPLAQAANSPLVGQLTVQTPAGVSPKEMMDEVVFALRKARRGGLYAR